MSDEVEKPRPVQILGSNSPEEMAKPPADREIKIGTKIRFSALGLTLALNEFVEEFLDAASKTDLHDGEGCRLHLVDTMDMARNFACRKIREQWEEDWKKKQQQESASGESVEQVLGEMLGVAKLKEDGYIAPIRPSDIRGWVQRIQDARFGTRIGEEGGAS